MFFIFLFFISLQKASNATGEIEIKQEDGFYINDPRYYEGIKHPYVINNFNQEIKVKPKEKEDNSNNTETISTVAQNIIPQKKDNTQQIQNLNQETQKNQTSSKTFDPFAKFEASQIMSEKERNSKQLIPKTAHEKFKEDEVVEINPTNQELEQQENPHILLQGLLYDNKTQNNSIHSLEINTNPIKTETALTESYQIKKSKKKTDIEKILKRISSAKNKNEEIRLMEKLQLILNKNSDTDDKSQLHNVDNIIKIYNPNLPGTQKNLQTRNSKAFSLENEAFAEEENLSLFNNSRLDNIKKNKTNNKNTNFNLKNKYSENVKQNNVKNDTHTINEDKKINKNSENENFYQEDDLVEQIPVRKSYKKNLKKQILPPNIAKATKKGYLRDNQHLETVVFKESLMKNAFLSIDSEDNIRIIGEIINQTQTPNMVDQDGNTLLHHAVNKNKYSLIRFLVQSGCDTNIKNKSGFTPLHLASSYGDYNSIYYLLAGGADPNKKDLDGNTSFMYAVATGDRELAKLMVSFGIRLYEKNNVGKTAINIAQEKNNGPVVAYLASLEDKFIP